MNPLVEQWKAEFDDACEIVMFAPGEQAKASARNRIDEILDEYNDWKHWLFVTLVEVDLRELSDGR